MGLGRLLCCFGPPAPRPKHRRRRSRRRARAAAAAAAAAAGAPVALLPLSSLRAAGAGGPPGGPASPLSEDGAAAAFFDARDDHFPPDWPAHANGHHRLSISTDRGAASAGGGPSPLGSPTGSVVRAHGEDGRYVWEAADGDEECESSEDEGLAARVGSWWAEFRAPAPPPPPPPPPPLVPPPGAALLAPEPPPLPPGCIALFASGGAGSASAARRFVRLAKPRAGASFSRLGAPPPPGGAPSPGAAAAALAWEPLDAAAFEVRSRDYMRSRVKEPSAPALYRPIGVDLFSFDFKLSHLARHVELPPPPPLGPAAAAARVPPLLIINLQLPAYAPSILGGATDGPGHSLVYYFALPPGWEPTDAPSAAAAGLFRRFLADAREADGAPSRDRLKLLGRVVNVEEWVAAGPLSGAEARLLRNYNGKPLLTRPQQRVYLAPDHSYLEIDVDVHAWAYVARRALHGFLGRLATVVFENAFVLQGNGADELPEVVLACVRAFRADLSRARPFPARSLEELAADAAAAEAAAAAAARAAAEGGGGAAAAPLGGTAVDGIL
jgi:hypothetical protein